MSEPQFLPRAPRRSLVEETIDLIRSQVEKGVWRVGERIPNEAELAEMLQVGRNTVREAVRVLSHARVLDVRQGDGTYVQSTVDSAEIMRRISRASLRDHFELRAILETEAARLAAVNCTDEDVQRLRHLLNERGERSDFQDLNEFLDRDLAFHGAIASASGNMALSELYKYFAGAVRLNTAAALAEQDIVEPGLDAHKAIVDAIQRRDAKDAADAAGAVVAPSIAALSHPPKGNAAQLVRLK
ncbi:FadR family transcriptional regulator [Agrobacterium rhizogenes]|uniref:FadR/GntR family transcriptional regulator n=1 Tax=Rhizobium rhizogenes TaxID=359 RepID=UPI0015724CBC|nr:FadR/GntR family transcriptional regulator [Rhizobium rhizogenes]NTH16762.1 FadR family transcriptional regulator [Rhizobium rhizogenes]